MSATSAFFVTPKNITAQLLNADGINTLKTVYTPTTAAKLASLMITSTETAVAHDVNIYVTKGGVDYLLGTVSVPINSGFTSGAPAVNAFNSTNMPGLAVDSDGNRYLMLEATSVLKASVPVIVTAAKALNFAGYGAEL
jgi:hypothetical protein